MKTFRINHEYQVVCDQQKTRNGFKHTAKLKQGTFYNTVAETKICYLNRTWESFEYESVLEKLLKDVVTIPKATITKFFKKERGEYKKQVKQSFGLISGIMAMGDLLVDTQKDKNDWKTRMLKAGFGDKGLIMPDDWDTLSEDVKEERLNNIIKLNNEL
jgi:hypothetical protein